MRTHGLPGDDPLPRRHSPFAHALALDDAARAEMLSALALTGTTRARRAPGQG